MLLVGVTGPAGSGKSTTLAELAIWAASEGLGVDGFTQPAVGTRMSPRRGAPGYDLERLGRYGGDADRAADAPSPTRLSFARRDRTKGSAIPYAFSADALATAHEWVRTALAEGPPDLLVLDEFGRVEAEGGGHMALWPEVEAAGPDIVVLAVREGVVPQVEARLGRTFDRVVRLDPDARIDPGPGQLTPLEELRVLVLEQRDWSRVGVYGAGSGGFEWSVGSALHAVRVPMRGLVLSSTQAAVMVFAGAGLGRRGRVVWVPFIAAGIKALSPAGSRIRAMLAITVQGMLFGGATRLLGWNPLGIFAGGALVGSWAVSQGLLLQYLLIGSDLLVAYQAVVNWVVGRWDVGVPGIAILLAAWVASWGLVAGTTALVAWRKGALPLRLREALDRGATGIRWEEPAPTWSSAMGRGARDILRPVFWLPVLLVLGILLSAGASWERAFWIGARALTVGMVVFSLVRAFDARGFVQWLRHRGHWGPAVAFERAMRR